MAADSLGPALVAVTIAVAAVNGEQSRSPRIGTHRNKLAAEGLAYFDAMEKRLGRPRKRPGVFPAPILTL
jgi:hypothetical protein